MHVHVGHNVPGKQPNDDPMCFDDLDTAVEAFAHELRDLQGEFQDDRCDRSSADSESERGECAWCDVAVDVEVVLSGIADGDVTYALRSRTDQDDPEQTYAVTLRTPDGPDACHWITVLGCVWTPCPYADEVA